MSARAATYASKVALSLGQLPVAEQGRGGETPDLALEHDDSRELAGRQPFAHSPSAFLSTHAPASPRPRSPLRDPSAKQLEALDLAVKPRMSVPMHARCACSLTLESEYFAPEEVEQRLTGYSGGSLSRAARRTSAAFVSAVVEEAEERAASIRCRCGAAGSAPEETHGCARRASSRSSTARAAAAGEKRATRCVVVSGTRLLRRGGRENAARDVLRNVRARGFDRRTGKSGGGGIALVIVPFLVPVVVVVVALVLVFGLRAESQPGHDGMSRTRFAFLTLLGDSRSRASILTASFEGWRRRRGEASYSWRRPGSALRWGGPGASMRSVRT
jgi:hypothetical protein